jgi:hypothetical protein
MRWIWDFLVYNFKRMPRWLQCATYISLLLVFVIGTTRTFLPFPVEGGVEIGTQDVTRIAQDYIVRISEPAKAAMDRKETFGSNGQGRFTALVSTANLAKLYVSGACLSIYKVSRSKSAEMKADDSISSVASSDALKLLWTERVYLSTWYPPTFETILIPEGGTVPKGCTNPKLKTPSVTKLFPSFFSDAYAGPDSNRPKEQRIDLKGLRVFVKSIRIEDPDNSISDAEMTLDESGSGRKAKLVFDPGAQLNSYSQIPISPNRKLLLDPSQYFFYVNSFANLQGADIQLVGDRRWFRSSIKESFKISQVPPFGTSALIRGARQPTNGVEIKVYTDIDVRISIKNDKWPAWVADLDAKGTRVVEENLISSKGPFDVFATPDVKAEELSQVIGALRRNGFDQKEFVVRCPIKGSIFGRQIFIGPADGHSTSSKLKVADQKLGCYAGA